MTPVSHARSVVRRRALSTILGAFLVAPAVQAQSTPSCDAMSAPVWFRVNPTSQASLLTRYESEAVNAGVNYGFTDDRGVAFRGAAAAGSGLVAVHRLYKPGSNDFVWIANQAEIANAVAQYGYVNQGVNFHAAPQASACTVPVYRYRKGAMHRAAVSQADRDALVAAGWQQETISFHAVPATTAVDTVFSIAMIPDTQNEVRPTVPRNFADTRFRDRSQWLVDHREALDIRFVGHTGDVVNWGERDEYQYQVASDGVQPLEAAGIPFSLSIGNHDTRAVCAGGSACPGESASVNVRLTPLFNQTFGGRFTAQAGAYEAGRVDNHYSLFEAGGKRWMVLVLELWPRTPVVAWARGVVAAHPQHNVIITTHAYLDGNGTISGSNGGYGANSPQYLFDNLVKLYPNIRFVFSGHTGVAASRTDTGVNGNRIVSMLQTFHATTNPVRLIEIDTVANTATTHIYAPQTNTHYPQYDASFDGLDYVD